MLRRVSAGMLVYAALAAALLAACGGSDSQVREPEATATAATTNTEAITTGEAATTAEATTTLPTPTGVRPKLGIFRTGLHKIPREAGTRFTTFGLGFQVGKKKVPILLLECYGPARAEEQYAYDISIRSGGFSGLVGSRDVEGVFVSPTKVEGVVSGCGAQQLEWVAKWKSRK